MKRTFPPGPVWILLLSGSSALPAQDILIDRIEERRSTSNSFFSNQCTINFSVRNLGENLSQYVRFTEVSKAVDSKGNALLNPEAMKWAYGKAGGSDLKLDLLSPAREAAAIKELAGNLSFFIPSAKNGSIVTIPRFTSRSEKNLLPKSASVSLVFLSEETIRKKAEETKKMQQEELDKMDEASRAMAQGIMGIFDGFSSWGGNNHSVHFMVEGDVNKLVDIEFLDSKGEKIDTNGKSSSEKQITYYFSSAPAGDWALKIFLETPKSVKKVPFSFKDVRLP